MDVETPDDDLTAWAIPLDEPAPPPTNAVPVSVSAPEVPDPPRLSLFSRDVPGRDFQPRLRPD